ncbi:Uncharacterised protein [Vibrio cholerae]|uniref:Uncharacterized protein n=1 Tax=Vibrio cholerae TaxID=666 RepID=A0A656A3P6_VIBCL|nr:Uncharacterised protein [Vibrio cholerae]
MPHTGYALPRHRPPSYTEVHSNLVLGIQSRRIHSRNGLGTMSQGWGSATVRH